MKGLKPSIRSEKESARTLKVLFLSPSQPALQNIQAITTRL